MSTCPICTKNKKEDNPSKIKLCKEHSIKLFQEIQEIIFKMNEEDEKELYRKFAPLPEEQRKELLNCFIENMEEMDKEGLLNENTTFADICDYAGKHVRLTPKSTSEIIMETYGKIED